MPIWTILKAVARKGVKGVITKDRRRPSFTNQRNFADGSGVGRPISALTRFERTRN